MATPNAVRAKVWNQTDFEEGAATEALPPGTGCVLTETDTGKEVRSANADESTTRVVREQRNPPRGMGAVGESPLEMDYAVDDNVETLGFNSNDHARCRAAYETDADGNPIVPDPGEEMGWNGSGELTTTAAEPVARFREDLSGNFDFEMARVEFL